MGTGKEEHEPAGMQSESQDVMQHTEEGPEHYRHDLIGVLLEWLD
jgi:hypothetical protein